MQLMLSAAHMEILVAPTAPRGTQYGCGSGTAERMGRSSKSSSLSLVEVASCQDTPTGC